MNLFQILKDTFGPLIDGKKPPLHVGEVMNLWFYLAATEETLRGEQVAFNTVQDDDLRGKLEDAITNVHNPIREELTSFLKKEGVPMPNTTPEKSFGDFKQISNQSKLTDEEAANLLVFNMNSGITYACRGMTEAVRNDVAMMFAGFLVRKTAFSVELKQMLTEKGWLKKPPAYIPQGSNTSVQET